MVKQHIIHQVSCVHSMPNNAVTQGVYKAGELGQAHK